MFKMTHIKYNKIHRLGKEEVEGILDTPVIVQEKIDGANASVWMEDGEMKFGSRNNEVTSFRGFPEYCKSHKGIKRLFESAPNIRLFGEWLVKHTLSYDSTKYQHFYLFDILENDVWWNPEEVVEVAKEFGIEHPQLFMNLQQTTEDEIMKFVGKSNIGERGEGVVIKNPNYVSKFGVSPQYAKIVTDAFKEQNAIVFGGNDKSSACYWEQCVSNEFMTLARVKKIIQKIESVENRPLDLKDIPRVSQTAYHDMLEEEIWTIQKKVRYIDFNTLKRICTKKAITIFKDILADDISVGYKEQ